MLASVPPMIICCVVAGTSQAWNTARYWFTTCGIPACDLGSPLIFWIAAMSSNHGQFWKSAGNLLQMKRPHSVGSHVLRLIDAAAQNNAGVKHRDPAILVGEVVHWHVGDIDVRLLYEFEFTQAAISQREKVSHLRQNVGSV